MKNIFRVEWLKIKNYPAFWWVMAMTILSYPGINLIFWKIFLNITQKKNQTGQIVAWLLGNPFAFPDTFHTTAYFSSFFVFIPSILVIMLITNEFTYKTNRQNIIDGWSREAFLWGKFINVLLTTLIVTLLFSIVAIVIGYAATTKMPENPFKEIRFIALFALQSFEQLSIAFLFGFVIRRSFLALSLFLFYYLVVENIVAKILSFKTNDWGRYLPLEVADRLIPIPGFLGKFDENTYKIGMEAIHIHIYYTLFMCIIVWIVCFQVNRKRDL
jgi:ABC-2 type transport system permease protein